MKIEDSLYPHNNGASPVEKLRRASQSSLDITLEDLDLSFLDLLTSVASDASANPLEKGAREKSALDKAKTNEKSAVPAEKALPRLSLVGKASEAEETDELNAQQVDRDMMLLKDELSDIDRQYLKQAVIPGLPILMGTVPFQSVFPSSPEGEISYKGFEVSPKLAELIEKGYKTGRPIRVELDTHSALVLKIRNGQVSAEFVSADKAAAFVMQQELDDLRNRLAARNLPVGTLEYKYQNPDQSGRQSRQEHAEEQAKQQINYRSNDDSER